MGMQIRKHSTASKCPVTLIQSLNLPEPPVSLLQKREGWTRSVPSPLLALVLRFYDKCHLNSQVRQRGPRLDGPLQRWEGVKIQ